LFSNGYTGRINGAGDAYCLEHWSGSYVSASPPISLERKKSMKNLLMRLWKEEEGQDTVEYALLLVLISLVAIVAMSNVGVAANKVFSNAAANLAT
jgi:Flp pilus assembly pilin Flp